MIQQGYIEKLMMTQFYKMISQAFSRSIQQYQRDWRRKASSWAQGCYFTKESKEQWLGNKNF